MDSRRESKPIAVSIGKRLAEAREKKSLSIDQVQKQTKIHSTVLIALEEGRASEILTDTYVRSFLKKYASYLGMDPLGILQEYFPSEHETPPAPVIGRENILPKDTALPPKFLYFTGITLIIIIAAFLVFFLGGKLISSLTRPKTVDHRPKTVEKAAQTKKKTAKITKSTPKKKTSAKTKSPSKELIPRSALLNLVIRVKEPVLIKLKKDGILLFERVMPAGTIETITAKDIIELGIGKASSIELALNGTPIALPGKGGINSLEITRKGVRLK